MPIELSEDVTKHAVASIRRYFGEALDLDIGDLKAGLLLDFIVREIGPSIYNSAVGDAQTFLRDRVADLDAICVEPEFAYFAKPAVRRRT